MNAERFPRLSAAVAAERWRERAAAERGIKRCTCGYGYRIIDCEYEYGCIEKLEWAKALRDKLLDKGFSWK